MTARLIWATPDAEKNILYCARVSSDDQDSEDTRLLKYLIKHKHWSPFEMANMCVEVITTKDVAIQILRHRSFHFQEFSQRYAQATYIEKTTPRTQDYKNRQNSFDEIDRRTKTWWETATKRINNRVMKTYNKAIDMGIAKESARRILPMATETKMYINGTLRSWIHYFDLRCDKATQREHRDVACAIRKLFIEQFPIIGEIIS